MCMLFKMKREQQEEEEKTKNVLGVLSPRRCFERRGRNRDEKEWDPKGRREREKQNT